MIVSPLVKRRQILLPTQETVDRHSVQVIVSSCYYNSILVRYGTGIAAINIVKNLIQTPTVII